MVSPNPSEEGRFAVCKLGIDNNIIMKIIAHFLSLPLGGGLEGALINKNEFIRRISVTRHHSG